MSKFKILSIDGGGVRGIIPARILQYVEEQSGKASSDLFDMFVGTSTGGLIALALTRKSRLFDPSLRHNANLAKGLVNVYLNYASTIFPHSLVNHMRSGFGLWGAKYSRDGFDSVADNIFMDDFIQDALKPVIIPSYSLINNAPSIFRSTDKDPKFLMSDIAGATSAAPTYLPPKVFTDNNGKEYMEIDGGIFVNNPEELAITEALLLNPELRRDDILVISIGCGTPKLNLNPNANSGLIGWGIQNNIIDVMLNASSVWESEEVNMLSPNTKRIQIELSEQLGSMDDSSPENMQALLAAAEKALVDDKSELDAIIAELLA